MTRLDQEEQEILGAFESGNTKRSINANQTQALHQSYSEAMVKKDFRRHSERSEERAKSKNPPAYDEVS